jgi:hypothetical protein
MATHKFLPGRPVALEALLDQLGILLQRIFSLLTCHGARRVCEPAPLSKSRLAVHLGLPTMERKLLAKCSPWILALLPTVLLGILLTARPGHKPFTALALRLPQATLAAPSKSLKSLKIMDDSSRTCV